MIDIEGILEEAVVKVIGHASRKNAFWLISMDRDCMMAPSTREDFKYQDRWWSRLREMVNENNSATVS
jgi:hypothetical protein